MMESLTWSSVLVGASVIGFIGLFLRKFLTRSFGIGNWNYEVIKSLWDVPGPPGLPIVGAITMFIGTPVEAFNTQRKIVAKYPNMFKIWAFYLGAINLYNPYDMEIIMSSSKFITKSMLYEWLMPWLNSGLLTSGGDQWRFRRKLLTPAFHFNILKEFVNVFEEHSLTLVDLLKNECDKESTDVIPFVTEFAIHTLNETTMGCKVDPNSKTIKDYKVAIHRFAEIMLHRLFRPWLYPPMIFNRTVYGRELISVLDTLHKFTSNVINERLETWDETTIMGVETASGKKRLAMLDLLITEMKAGANITIDGIREEVDTFMFEGHDTTSMGISFFLMVLANHKDIQERIVNEVRSILGNDQRTATIDELQAMTYLDMCIKESLRLYPSVPFISRKLTDDVILGNKKIAKGIFVHLHIFDLHRNPEIWPDPTTYDPDRFLPENSIHRHPFAYLPFSAGPRNCIGQRFAQLEMKSFISKVLLEYVLEPVDTPETVQIIADMVLRPRDGIRVRFRKRDT